jgi:hypothetical protein
MEKSFILSAQINAIENERVLKLQQETQNRQSDKSENDSMDLEASKT